MKTKLDQQIAELVSLIPQMDIKSSEVSSATVGWQINHALLVLIGSFKALIKSDPSKYEWRFNKNRSYLKVANKIPRGKIRAPKIVAPPENLDKAVILEAIENAKSILARGKTLDKNAHFQHPFIGILNLKNSFWFIELHTQHHLNIIEDILKANKK